MKTVNYVDGKDRLYSDKPTTSRGVDKDIISGEEEMEGQVGEGNNWEGDGKSWMSHLPHKLNPQRHVVS